MMMRALTILALLVIVCIPDAYCDGAYIPRIDQKSVDADVSEPSQKAIISHFDNEEQMILQVSYRGKTSGFVWLIPTPSLPDIKLFDMPVFESMAETTAPRLRYWFDVDKRGLGVLSSRSASINRFEDVDVLERKQLAGYDVSVLRANNGGELVSWLRANQYNVTPAIENVVSEYLSKGWVFTAARVNTGDTNIKEGMLKPLLFKFQSSRPIYPLKISSLNKGKTKLLLYVVTSHRVEADNLQVKHVFSNHDKTLGYWNSQGCRLLRCALPEGMDGYGKDIFVTKLSGEMQSSDMTGDIIFKRASHDQVLYPTVPAPFFDNIGKICMFCLGNSFIILPFVFAGCIVASFWANGKNKQTLLWIGIAPFAFIALLHILNFASMLGMAMDRWTIFKLIMLGLGCWILYRVYKDISKNKNL